MKLYIPITIILLVGLLGLVGVAHADYAGYNYYKVLPITGSSDGAGWFQQRLIVHAGAGTDGSPTAADVYLNSHSLSWSGTNAPKDLRFVNANTSTNLQYMFEANDSTTAYVWILPDNIPASPSKYYVKMYYGKSSDTDASNPYGVWLLYDTFTGSNLNANWTTNQGGAGSNTVSGGILNLYGTGDGSTWYFVDSANNYGSGTMTISYCKITSSGGFGGGSYGFNAGTTWNYWAEMVKTPSVNAIRTKNGGTDTTVASNVDQNTYHVYMIKRTSTQVRFYRDYTAMTGSPLTTNLPAGAIPIGYSSSSGTTPTVVDWIMIGNTTLNEPTMGAWSGEQQPTAIPATDFTAPIPSTTPLNRYYNILDPYTSNDGTVQVESSVIYDSNPVILTGYTHVFKMWYRGKRGFDLNIDANLNYAESPDGLTWTKYTGNPLLSGIVCPQVFKYNGVYYLYANTKSSSYKSIDRWTSNDGVTFTKDKTGALTTGGQGTWDRGVFGNNYVWVEGGTWYMVYEAGTQSEPWVWKLGLATSTDGVTWTKSGSNPILSKSGAVGGPMVKKIGSTYYMWLHQAPASYNLPTDIYTYMSSDLVSWSAVSSNSTVPRLSALEGVGNNDPNNGGQTADAFVMEVYNKTFIYYSQVPNQSVNYLGVGIANMSLSNFIRTKEGNPSDSNQIVFGDGPLSVTFTDSSTNTPTSWLWDFGDGNTSTSQNPTHIFYTPGTYTISLNASNAAGSNTMTKTGYVVVNTVWTVPTVVFTGTPLSGNSPLNVQFTDQSTSNNDITSWNWNFGDGTANSTLQNPVHQYSSGGNFNVTLTVYSLGGTNSTKKTNYVSVNQIGPSAQFVANPTGGNLQLSVQFTDQSTGTPTGWNWNFGDGTANSTLQNPQHQYTTQGTFTVTLTVTNAGGSGGIQKQNYITVTTLPVPSFTSNVTNGSAPLTVQFTDTSLNYPTSWTWDFGDGQISHAQNPQHQYNNPGYYSVGLTVSNENGTNSMLQTNYIYVTTVPTPTPTPKPTPNTYQEEIMGHKPNPSVTVQPFNNTYLMAIANKTVPTSLDQWDPAGAMYYMGKPFSIRTGNWWVVIVLLTIGGIILLSQNGSTVLLIVGAILGGLILWMFLPFDVVYTMVGIIVFAISLIAVKIIRGGTR